VAAPGYAMHYVWMIPHLADARFGPDSRQFVAEHSWLLGSEGDR
jgi:5-deoxy-glucuronate isomerase